MLDLSTSVFLFRIEPQQANAIFISSYLLYLYISQTLPLNLSGSINLILYSKTVNHQHNHKIFHFFSQLQHQKAGGKYT